MKIGILTLDLNKNYGGILQCYALQTVLERMGNEVSVLYVKKVAWYIRLRLIFSRFIKAYILKTEPEYYGMKTEKEILMQNTQPFINKYIRLKKVQGWQCFSEKDFNAIIVGSDQIWRPFYFQPIQNAYLSFAQSWKNVKRIAYAASFGTDEWEYTSEETKVCSELIKKFDAVSVRELSGVNLCRKYLQINAIQLVDPTLLLSPDDYLSIISDATLTERRNGLLCYILDGTEEKYQFANILATQKGLTPFLVNNPKTETDEYFADRIQLPVDQWIAGFRDAEFVVTDSFHGCIFSILFNKPFIVIGNTIRGMSRINSLLKIFHLENRLVMVGDTQAFLERSSIPWEEINCILEKERKRAFEFLNQNLANTKKLFY